jgi:aspartyl/asparaginyl-tRNA synthetase
MKKFGNPVSILEIKQIFNKVLKNLREELAMTNSISVKRMNADLIEYESSQRQHTEKLRSISYEDLIKIIGDLK